MGSCETVHRPKLGDKCHIALEVLGKGCPYTHCSADMYGLGCLFFSSRKRQDRQRCWHWNHWKSLGSWWPCLRSRALLPPVSTQSSPSLSLRGLFHVFAKPLPRWRSPHLSTDFPKHWTEMLITLAGRHLSGTEEIPPHLKSPSATLGPLLERQCLD